MNALSNSKGFSLVELIGVMLIMGILIALVIPKYISMNENIGQTAIEMAVVDLNGRELKEWTSEKLGSGWENDKEIFESCDYDFEKYVWTSLDQSGGTMHFKETVVNIVRKNSTDHEPANWSIDLNIAANQ